MNCRMVACFIGFFLTNFLASAQSLQMNQWLNVGTEEDRTKKLVALGIEEDQARLAVGGAVKWHPLRSESKSGLAILFVPCGTFDASYLYLLEHANAGWHARDSVGFDCHYDDSVSVETTPLQNPNVDDVLVHHECEERGTGYVEQHFNVFAVISGKFKSILNTKEVVRENGWPKKYEFRLRSKFAVLSSEQSASRIIEETQCVNDNGKISVQQRRFNWNESAFLLVPTDFVKVPLGDAKMKANCR